ncbi:MAG TPA: phosphatidate cytidylyltransferase [Gaiellaceae bacterium]|nr:phosphatidate cytidylyltransferase [Gaiellaceae bacterium]
MSPLASRLLVAALGLPLVLGALWAGGWWLFALVVAGALLALHEFFAITKPLRPIPLAGYAGLVGVLCAMQDGDLVWTLGAVLGTLALAFLLKGLAATQGSATVSVGVTVLGTAWVGLGLGFVLGLRDLPEYGLVASLAVLLAIFADDTAAYFGGRALGRHKLAPAISPGKTWEGFVFGTLAAVFVVFVALYQDREEFLTIGQSLLLGVVVALAGPLGDLFESMVKRDLGVKDSGRLLAGHGGVLDRIDAILFAFPAAFLTVYAF